jgi:hypothetical protein
VISGSMMAKVCKSTPGNALFATACNRKAWKSTSPTNPIIMYGYCFKSPATLAKPSGRKTSSSASSTILFNGGGAGIFKAKIA